LAVTSLSGAIAEEFVFPAGSIVVFDKAYTDLELFKRWWQEGVILWPA
jgi:hypothetical protein